MCNMESRSGCTKRNGSDPQKCSEKQIQECHGNSDTHPCVSDKQCKNQEKTDNLSNNGTSGQTCHCHDDNADRCNEET